MMRFLTLFRCWSDRIERSVWGDFVGLLSLAALLWLALVAGFVMEAG